jgi:hypothetical protein
MSLEGHQERFPLPSLRDRYGFREGTFAGARVNGRDAPIPDLRARSAGASTGSVGTSRVAHSASRVSPQPRPFSDVLPGV